MSGVSYPLPSKNTPIFNPVLFSENTTPLTIANADKKYLSLAGGNISSNLIVAGNTTSNSATITTANIDTNNANIINFQDGSIMTGNDLSLDYTTFGKNWNNACPSLSTSFQLTNVCCSGNGMYVYISNESGSLYSNNYGKTFSSSNLPTTFSIYTNISCSKNGKYVIVCSDAGSGISSSIYYSSDYGITFLASNFPATWGILDCDVNSSGSLMVACVYNSASYGVIYSVDYGYTWTNSNAPVNKTYSCISLNSNGKNCFVGCQSGQMIYSSSNYAQTFASAFSPILYYKSISMSANGKYIFASVM